MIDDIKKAKAVARYCLVMAYFLFVCLLFLSYFLLAILVMLVTRFFGKELDLLEHCAV